LLIFAPVFWIFARVSFSKRRSMAFINSTLSFSPFSRHLRTSVRTKANALICFDDRWVAFADRVPDDNDRLARMSDQDLIGHFEIDPQILREAIPIALSEWRISPTRSLINILAGINGAVPSGPMFSDLAQQTRVLAAAVKSGAVSYGDVRGVSSSKKGMLERVANDAYAATLDDHGRRLLNDIARAFHAWELRNRARIDTGLVKIPRLLYRGIRSRDIDIDGAFNQRADEAWNLRFCRLFDARRDELSKRPLTTISGTPIISFTSSESIARYYADGEGMVVEVDPAKFMVVASWSLDAALDGKDEINGKHEREWIVRVDPSFVLRPDEIKPWDRIFAYSTNDPKGIEMLDHYTRARYRLDGRLVEAYFQYNASGTGGKRMFYVNGDHFAKTRMAWRRENGFDPVPAPGRVVENLEYFDREPFSRSRRRYAPYESESRSRDADSKAISRSPSG